MHFDDRLDTVLRLPALGKAYARTQYRQLIDILGNIHKHAESPQIDSAYRKLAALAGTIPATERAQMLQQSGSRLRSPRLLAALLDGEPGVASTAIAAAQISEDEWLRLIPELPIRARGILRHRRGLGPKVDRLLEQLGIGDRGLPPAETGARSAAENAASDEPLELVDLAPVENPEDAKDADSKVDSKSDISALLKRIEQFNRNRRAIPHPQSSHGDAPRLPLEEVIEETHGRRSEPFDFEANAEGCVTWAGPAVAPMVVGLRLASGDHDNGLAAPPEMRQAIRHRQPLTNIPVTIRGAPAVSGDWQLDAAPRFDPAMGGFAGYAGRFRRPAASPAPESRIGEASDDSDRIRQILHELRTPANAIQISAEIIQQNLFGPTPHEYRAIAAMIASDTAYVLAGFDELERLAKLEGHSIELDEGTCDIAAVVAAIVDQLHAHTAKRESGFVFEPVETAIQIGLTEVEAERLAWRVLAVLAGEAAPNERLALTCKLERGEAVLRAGLPAALAAEEGDALFSANARPRTSPRVLSAGMFGTGFSLRLARAEVKAAGGSLKRDGNHLCLILPGITAHSEQLDQA